MSPFLTTAILSALLSFVPSPASAVTLESIIDAYGLTSAQYNFTWPNQALDSSDANTWIDSNWSLNGDKVDWGNSYMYVTVKSVSFLFLFFFFLFLAPGMLNRLSVASSLLIPPQHLPPLSADRRLQHPHQRLRQKLRVQRPVVLWQLPLPQQVGFPILLLPTSMASLPFSE